MSTPYIRIWDPGVGISPPQQQLDYPLMAILGSPKSGVWLYSVSWVAEHRSGGLPGVDMIEPWSY